MNIRKAICTGLCVLLAAGVHAQIQIPKPPIHLLHYNELASARHTTIWVDGTFGLEQHSRYEQIPNQLLPAYIEPQAGMIHLLTDTVNVEEGYVKKAFLINTTADTVLIERADATVANIRTEVYTRGEWLTLQKDRGASCGNSYWTMYLAPKHYLILKIQELLPGPVKVPYRIILKVDGKEVASDPTFVSVPQALLNLAGSPFADSYK